MGRFKGKDLYLKHDDQIYFGDNLEAALWYDDSDLQLDHTLSGVAATQPYHLVQKQYVDDQIAIVSGTHYAGGMGEWRYKGTSSDADPGNGNFKVDNFDQTLVTEIYISNTNDAGIDLKNVLSSFSVEDSLYIQLTKDADQAYLYELTGVTDNTTYHTLSVTYKDDSGTAFTNNKDFLFIKLSKKVTVITDHGDLTGLGNDDHIQYILVDGSRGFTSTVSGVDPVSGYDLTTKSYVDDEIATVSGGEAGPPGFGLFASARVSAAGTALDSVNLSVNKSATGTYDFTFTSRPKDAYYSVQAQPYQTVTDTNAMISNVATTGFTVTVGQGDNGSTPDVLADTDFSVVVFNSEGSTTAASGVGYLCACQIRRTTDYTYTTSWANITCDTTDVENTTIITHDATNTERINIGATGVYLISYDMKAHLDPNSTNTIQRASGRVLINGTTVVDGSSIYADVYQSEIHDVDCTVVAELTAGDYITLQAMTGGTDTMTASADTTFNVVKLDGIKGDKGDQGTPGQDGVDGVVTVSGTSTGYFDGYDSSGGTVVGTTWVDVPLNAERYKSTNLFSHTTPNAEVTINESYTYVVTARVTTAITTGTSRTDSIMRIVRDTGSGYVEVPGTRGKMYNRTLNNGENTATVSIVIGLNKGDKIKVQAVRDTGTSTLGLEANGSSLSIFTTTGEKGDPGEDGAPGSGSSIIVKKEGTTVSGSPFSALNFTGAAVNDIVDEGSGQVEVYIEPEFGAWYGWNSSEAESSTTSTTYVNKVTYTTSTIPAGYYRIGWQFEWRRGSTTNDFRARVQIDNTTDIMEMNEESKDSNSWHPAAGFDIVQLTAGTHTIDIDFAGETTGSTSYIRRARIEFWMMSS